MIWEWRRSMHTGGSDEHAPVEAGVGVELQQGVDDTAAVVVQHRCGRLCMHT